MNDKYGISAYRATFKKRYFWTSEIWNEYRYYPFYYEQILCSQSQVWFTEIDAVELFAFIIKILDKKILWLKGVIFYESKVLSSAETKSQKKQSNGRDWPLPLCNGVIWGIG